MFNNLIESTSHRNELQRRGSFFLFTTATYLLLFAIAGVVSTSAYDARLEQQNTEIITLLTPSDFPIPRPPSIARSTTNHSANPRTFDERRIAMLSVNRPDVTPRDISTEPNPHLPLRSGITTLITDRDIDGGAPGGRVGTDNGGGTRPGNTVPIIQEIGTPPPRVEQKPIPRVVHKGVITGEAILLPKPPYPPMARQIRVTGPVSVQVLIDETGRVVTAHAINGHPLLMAGAVAAAYHARFSPTLIGDQPVKVSGVITYNFVLQ